MGIDIEFIHEKVTMVNDGDIEMRYERNVYARFRDRDILMSLMHMDDEGRDELYVYEKEDYKKVRDAVEFYTSSWENKGYADKVCRVLDMFEKNDMVLIVRWL